MTVDTAVYGNAHRSIYSRQDEQADSPFRRKVRLAEYVAGWQTGRPDHSDDDDHGGGDNGDNGDNGDHGDRHDQTTAPKYMFSSEFVLNEPSIAGTSQEAVEYLSSLRGVNAVNPVQFYLGPPGTGEQPRHATLPRHVTLPRHATPHCHATPQTVLNRTTSSSSRYTALHYAAYHGHAGVVDVLLEANADASLRNAAGETAVESAAAKGFDNICDKVQTAAQQQRWQPLQPADAWTSRFAACPSCGGARCRTQTRSHVHRGTGTRTESPGWSSCT